MKYLKLFESVNIFKDIIDQINDIKFILEDEGYNVLLTTPEKAKEFGGFIIVIQNGDSSGARNGLAHWEVKLLVEKDCYIEFFDRVYEIAKGFDVIKNGDWITIQEKSNKRK